MSPLESSVDAKYATCPRDGCDFKLLIDLKIVGSEDQTITTISSRKDTP